MDSLSAFDLSGRAALVTGGNGGIGRSLALGLAGAGASVAIAGRNEDKNARVLEELRAIGNPAMAFSLDVTQRSALDPAVRRIEDEPRPPGILVNIPGIVSIRNAAFW